MSTDRTTRDKLGALVQVALYRPFFTTGVVILSILAAVFEGIGVSFLLPIIETVKSSGDPSQDGLVSVFLSVYDYLGIPFSIEYIIVGVGAVMVLRYVSSFLVGWMKAKLRMEYVRDLQKQSFERALSARVSYFDAQGSDDILNNIVTQARYAGRVVEQLVRLVEQGFLSFMYFAVALLLAPKLTIITAVVLGGALIGLRKVIEAGFDIGEQVADANEEVQSTVQAGMQGIRDVKLFTMTDELRREFESSVNQFASSSVRLWRNEMALDNFYQLAVALSVFGLIYGALRFTPISLAGLGVFLFAMFRLAPRISTINNIVYKIEGDLPHLVRTQEFISNLSDERESTDGSESVPDSLKWVEFDSVSFSYDSDEMALRDLSFEAEMGDFIAFVGPSGAGKSTIVSLLTSMYTPDTGRILANSAPISRFPIKDWRKKISVVRQDSYIFNDTLRYNITIGNREASEEELREVSEIASIDEFLDQLPDGFDTVLGDDGVKLSGGQRQRISIARALLKDADILVLDEATSDLDSNIEADVHTAIEGMNRDYMMLTIAHRLSTVQNADRIYSIEDGEVTETGTHRQLIREDGTYSELYAAQSNGGGQ